LHGRTHTNRDLSRQGKLPAGLLHFEQTINTHGNHGNSQAVGQNSDAGLEWKHLARRGVVTFRKDEHAVSAIDALACISETLTKSRLARQGKDVQECCA
jgi:hypothetical protein